MKQPYRDLKVKAKQVDDAVSKLLQERQDYNEAFPDKAYPVLFEELLEALDITKAYWDKYRDFNDPLQSPDSFKDYNPSSNDKDYKIYISLYKQRIDIQESIKKAEQKLGIGVVKTGFINPRLQTYCIWLSKQKYYGGYSDKGDAGAAGDVKISIKLLDDKGRQM